LEVSKQEIKQSGVQEKNYNRGIKEQIVDKKEIINSTVEHFNKF